MRCVSQYVAFLSVPLFRRSTDEEALADAISVGASRYHGIDGVILNAGILDPLCRIGDDTPLDSWKKHFDVNFFSLVTAVKAALPYLRKSSSGGRIVFVSSGAAVKGLAGWGPYNAGKAAMNSLCRYIPFLLASMLS
jgi:NAD(P)-dependent dehydrogenase (short-subunit alcohol dehydrogenase family)